MNRWSKYGLRLAVLMVTLALCASSAAAQHRMSGGFSHGGFGARAFPAGGRRSTLISGRGGRSGGRRGFYGYPGLFGDYGYPYYWDDYGPDDPNSPPQDAPAQPPAAPAPETKAETLPDPELLELHGNQWVRVTNFSAASEQALNAQAPAEKQASAKPREMPAAILVFRDGHTEEVSSYSIIGQSIYTKENYWTTGAWTRTIQIADLDIPATLKQNQERGVPFELPSGPDEVMIRP